MSSDRAVVVFTVFPFGDEPAGMIADYSGDGFRALINSVGVWLGDHLLDAPDPPRGVWIWEGEIGYVETEDDVEPVFNGDWRRPGDSELLQFQAARLWRV